MIVLLKKRIILFFILFCLIIGIFAIIRQIYYNDIEHIQYNGRTYIKSAREVDYIDMDNIKTTINTGKRVKGMEVFDVKDNKNTSTIIYLKTKDGKFLIYGLSGGA